MKKISKGANSDLIDELRKRLESLLSLTMDNADTTSCESILPCTKQFLENLCRDIKIKFTKIHIPSVGFINFKIMNKI